jgi:prepilin-type processing-associated H-X9-DG protein
LLVVIAIIAILAAMLLPALSRAKCRAQGISCMNNTKQLTIGWMMYTGDNLEKFPKSGLVAGGMSWNSSSDNTNSGLLVDTTQSPLAAYCRSAGVWHCPADNYKSAANPGPRVRSLSINAVLGNKADITGQATPNRDYLETAVTWSDLVLPGAANVFAFLDEHPDSINDALFVHLVGRPAVAAEWRDLPASQHCGSCNFSFADGHSEIHKWLETEGATATVRPVQYIDLPNFACRNSRDYVWMGEHMPYRAK